AGSDPWYRVSTINLVDTRRNGAGEPGEGNDGRYESGTWCAAGAARARGCVDAGRVARGADAARGLGRHRASAGGGDRVAAHDAGGAGAGGGAIAVGAGGCGAGVAVR